MWELFEQQSEKKTVLGFNLNNKYINAQLNK